jgi:N-acetylmuramoyl-L-alanine amidase
MNPFRVCLDPGHGNGDFGAVYASMKESSVNLQVALLVRELIRKNTGYGVILTRETDEFIPLGQRVRISNIFGADYFLSIHCNADADSDQPGMPEAKGEEIWYPEGSEPSLAAAKLISDEVNKFFPDEPFRGVKMSPYHHIYVLGNSNRSKYRNLIELGFIDCSATSAKFSQPEVLSRIAELIVTGIGEVAALKV